MAKEKKPTEKELIKEFEAVKKAKAENDERFMRERDDARAKAEEFRIEMDKQTALKNEERQSKLDALREVDVLQKANSQLVDEKDKLVETLKVRTEVNKATLNRCNALDELVAAFETTAGAAGVLQEVQRERERQDAKWGVQNHPDGTCAGPNGAVIAKQHADAARSVCDQMAKLGKLTWAHILTEELMEAYAETDEQKLRKELIQTAAVAVSWIEAIDRRIRGRTSGE